MAADQAAERFTVTSELVTEHLPPDRQVLTTPGMIGLMELCVAGAEPGAGWSTASLSVRHRAGLGMGKGITIQAAPRVAQDGRVTWSVTATADDGTLLGDGEIVRRFSV